jgi:hypothetical protein
LQQPNDPIVLELLADRPHEDWAQDHLRREYIQESAGRRRPSGLTIARIRAITLRIRGIDLLPRLDDDHAAGQN